MTNGDAVTSVAVTREQLADLKQLQVNAERTEKRRIPLAEIVGRLLDAYQTDQQRAGAVNGRTA